MASTYWISRSRQIEPSDGTYATTNNQVGTRPGQRPPLPLRLLQPLFAARLPACLPSLSLCLSPGAAAPAVGPSWASTRS